MADDIVELKPGIGPVKINLRALWRRLTEKPKSNPAFVIAERFVQLFEAHGVSVTQIPRFVPRLSLADFCDQQTLLRALTPAIVDEAAALFGVQRSWLEGTTNRIYVRQPCYKNPAALFSILKAIRFDPHTFPLRVITSCRNFDYHSQRSQPLLLVLVEKLASVDDVDEIWDIDRYIVMDEWDWSHLPCRIQLKAMVRVVDLTIGERVPIFHVTPSEFVAVAEGRRVPREFLTRCLLTSPSLEDYSCSDAESAVAKETDELPVVLNYLTEHNLEALVGRNEAHGLK